MNLQNAITYLLDEILDPMIDACGSNVKENLVQARHALARTRDYEMDPADRNWLAQQIVNENEGEDLTRSAGPGKAIRYRATGYRPATAYCQIFFTAPPMGRHKLRRIGREALEKMPDAAYSLHGVNWEEGLDVEVGRYYDET